MEPLVFANGVAVGHARNVSDGFEKSFRRRVDFAATFGDVGDELGMSREVLHEGAKHGDHRRRLLARGVS